MPVKVKPFSATHYNTDLFKNYSLAVCPPYDVISPKQLESLRKKSPYNFSNVLIADDSNYEKRAQLLRDWLGRRVLVDDKQECFYLYEQKFNIEGKVFKRYGILSLLHMDNSGIFPHEHTLSAPKEDRKKIINSTQANLSPIFAIAARPLKAFSQVYSFYCRKKPFLKFKDDEGNANRVWKVSDAEQIAKISGELGKCKLVIADGHHRFEISYDYFKNNKDKFKDLDYILAYITDCQKGLVVLPTHRVVELAQSRQEVFEKLKSYFDIKEISESALGKKLQSTKVFCMGMRRASKFYYLKLKKLSMLDKIPNKLYKELDTYVFHQLILPLFKAKGNIEYTHTIKDAKKLAGKDKTAFLLRAVSLESVFKISSRGFRLPQKSTYFYPKVLSGIVIRRFQNADRRRL